jgi:hypothetical protein
LKQNQTKKKDDIRSVAKLQLLFAIEVYFLFKTSSDNCSGIGCLIE